MKAHKRLFAWRQTAADGEVLSQTKAAAMFDVSLRTYQYWESGEFAPNRESSALLHAVVGIPTVDWVSSSGSVEEHVG